MSPLAGRTNSWCNVFPFIGWGYELCTSTLALCLSPQPLSQPLENGSRATTGSPLVSAFTCISVPTCQAACNPLLHSQSFSLTVSFVLNCAFHLQLVKEFNYLEGGTLRIVSTRPQWKEGYVSVRAGAVVCGGQALLQKKWSRGLGWQLGLGVNGCHAGPRRQV